MKVRQEPEKARLIPWEEATKPYQRIHIDFLGPFKSKMYLVIIDAFTKWPEVFEMKSTTTEITIEALRETFARYGIPETMVSDNGTQFTANKFLEFCKINGIQHLCSPPFNPSTNGLAENFVKSFKNGIQKACNDGGNENVTLTTIINRYLLTYRTTVHSTTGETPSNLMFKREIRTRLELLRNNTREKARTRQKENFKGNRQITFEEGDVVFARDYRNINKKTWEKGTVNQVIGNQNYVIKTCKEQLLWRRHINQLLKGGDMDVAQEKERECEENNTEKQREMIITEKNKRVLEGKREANDEKSHSSRGEDLAEGTWANAIKEPTQPVSGEKAEELKEAKETEEIVRKSPSKPAISDRPRRNIKPPDRLNL